MKKVSTGENKKSESQKREMDVSISGRTFTVTTSEPEKLKMAAEQLSDRLDELRLSKPFTKSSDLETLLLLEVALEKEELSGQGKALLKKVDDLLKWVDKRVTK